jgi:uncharacterized damage-inducible protein DinB
MPQKSDAMELLLIHNEWANRQLLETCRGLTDEQFHRKFEMGPGSLHDTMAHVFDAVGIWSDMIAGRERRQIVKQTRTVDELLAYMEKNHAEFNALIAAKPASATFSATRMGKTYTFTYGGVVTHVMTHGMHHRAQCLNMLRHVGAKQPMSSVAEWMRENDQPT